MSLWVLLLLLLLLLYPQYHQNHIVIVIVYYHHCQRCRGCWCFEVVGVVVSVSVNVASLSECSMVVFFNNIWNTIYGVTQWVGGSASQSVTQWQGHLLSCLGTAKNCCQKLLSKIVVKNCRKKLSSKIFIKNFRRIKDVIKNCHKKF